MMTHKKKRNILAGLFGVYILFVIKSVILKYPIAQLMEIARPWTREVVLEGLDTANFTLFKTIRMYIVYADRLNSVENLVGNIVVFVPLGMFLPLLFQTCERMTETMMVSFILIVGIELFQLFSAFGAFDVDDILLNCLGSFMGFGLYRVIRHFRRKRERTEDR